MNIFEEITGNYILVVAFSGWFAAQAIKVITDLCKAEFHWERLVGAGGFPSSHSSLVTAMAIAVMNKTGIHSVEFAIAFTLSVIVMYDAMGVRRAAGEQAKIINKMMRERRAQGKIGFDDDEVKKVKKIDQQLKEYLGHTPFEVLGGILVGAVVAFSVPIF